jgi:hypothetical protein
MSTVDSLLGVMVHRPHERCIAGRAALFFYPAVFRWADGLMQDLIPQFC